MVHEQLPLEIGDHTETHERCELHRYPEDRGNANDLDLDVAHQSTSSLNTGRAFSERDAVPLDTARPAPVPALGSRSLKAPR